MCPKEAAGVCKIQGFLSSMVVFFVQTPPYMSESDGCASFACHLQVIVLLLPCLHLPRSLKFVVVTDQDQDLVGA